MVRHLVCQTKRGRCFVLGFDSPTVLVVDKKLRETGSLPLIKFFSLFRDCVSSLFPGPIYSIAWQCHGKEGTAQVIPVNIEMSAHHSRLAADRDLLHNPNAPERASLEIFRKSPWISPRKAFGVTCVRGYHEIRSSLALKPSCFCQAGMLARSHARSALRLGQSTRGLFEPPHESGRVVYELCVP